jgi:ubiquinone/menaquinone biosynthesis C-methylase UbiE
MNALDKLKQVVAEEYVVRLIEEDIHSILPDSPLKHHYDKRATVYDFVVGTRLYNSVMWGSSPLDYTAFARQAFLSSPRGCYLDAACGSLLFTAQVYLECTQQVVAFDQSLAMLRRARARLITLAGHVPEHILLLQGDLSCLPFRPARFHSILCMNVLHHFKDAAGLIPGLRRLLDDDGHLYLTSLVRNNRFVGDYYLKLLHATGELVRPRSGVEVRSLFENSSTQKVSFRTKGNMAFVTTASML